MEDKEVLNLEKLSPNIIAITIKALIYLKNIDRLKLLVESFNISEAPIASSIIVLQGISSIKDQIPERILFKIKLEEELNIRTQKFKETIASL